MSLSETFGAKARRQLLGSIPVAVGLVILGALLAVIAVALFVRTRPVEETPLPEAAP